MEVIRKYKTYQNRKLHVYENGRRINIVMPWMGWISHSYSASDLETHKRMRKVIMEHLYWLLGKDCDYETWKQNCDDWNEGKHIYGVPVDQLTSMFFESEYEIALNSFYNN